MQRLMTEVKMNYRAWEQEAVEPPSRTREVHEKQGGWLRFEGFSMARVKSQVIESKSDRKALIGLIREETMAK